MTDTEIRIAIARKCGWKVSSGDDEQMGWHMAPEGSSYMDSPHLPDYPNDLNAMHSAEEILHKNHDNAELFIHELKVIVYRTKHSGVSIDFTVANSDARQRAEAFLRTFGLWKEQKDSQ